MKASWHKGSHSPITFVLSDRKLHLSVSIRRPIRACVDATVCGVSQVEEKVIAKDTHKRRASESQDDCIRYDGGENCVLKDAKDRAAHRSAIRSFVSERRMARDGHSLTRRNRLLDPLSARKEAESH